MNPEQAKTGNSRRSDRIEGNEDAGLMLDYTN
jgi:hypothetical protein